MDDKTLVLRSRSPLYLLSHPLLWIGGIGIGLLLALPLIEQGEGKQVFPPLEGGSVEVSPIAVEPVTPTEEKDGEARRPLSEEKREETTVARLMDTERPPDIAPKPSHPPPPSSPPHGPRPVTPPPSPTPSVEAGLLLYRQGKIKEAITSLTKTALTHPEGKGKMAREYITIIQGIRNHYETGLHSYQNGQPTHAFAEWKKLLEQERRLMKEGEGSWFGRSIARYAADEFYKRGRDHYARGNLPEALIEWQKALKADNTHREAVEGMKKLTDIARQIYREGYILEEIDIEEALEKWREVLKIVPPGNEYYAKAEEKLRTRSMSP